MLEPHPAEAPLLTVQNLTMDFPLTRGLTGRPAGAVRAVDDVSFSIDAGQTFGLVGESGCGKSTTGRCVLRLLSPVAGRIVYKGIDLVTATAQQFRPYRRELQLIFQDPYGSLDPRQSASSVLAEAIQAESIQGNGQPRGRSALREQVEELLDTVELGVDIGQRYPHEMSGGQRQRLGIARALACRPALIVCDEPVSALDVSIQAQIINLFKSLQRRLGLTYLFIAHDLAVVRHISHTIGVMYLGRLVEVTDAEDLYDHPLHPYTKALLSAIPLTDYAAEMQRARIVLPGEVPSPSRRPAGCPFHPRCGLATDICRTVVPELRTIEGHHRVACHHVG